MDRRRFLQGVATATTAGHLVSPSRATQTRLVADETNQAWRLLFETEIEKLDDEPDGFALAVTDSAVVLQRRAHAVFDAQTGERLRPVDFTVRLNAFVADGMLLLQDHMTESDDHTWLRAVSVGTGETAWEQQMEPHGLAENRSAMEVTWDVRYVQPAVYDSMVLLPHQESVTAVSLADGSIQWTFPIEKTVVDTAVSGDRAYVTTGSGTLICLDITEQTRQWMVNVPDTDRPLTSLAVAGDTILAADANGVYAVSTEGDHLWMYQQEQKWRPTGPIPTSNKYCYIRRKKSEETSPVVALDLETGDEQWTKTLPQFTEPYLLEDQNVFSPRIADGVVWTPGDGYLMALDADTGDVVKRIPLSGKPRCSPAVHDGTVFVATRDAIYAFEPTGECDKPQLQNISARYKLCCVNDEAFSIEGQISNPECYLNMRIEVWVNSERGTTRRLNVTQSEFDFLYEHPDLPRDTETVTVKLRNVDDGTVLDERTVEFPDYRDEPPQFFISEGCEEVQNYRKIKAGESFSVTVKIQNNGSAGSYVARLLRDETGVDESSGSLQRFVSDDGGCHNGEDLTLSSRFTEPGEYELTATIEPEDGNGSGDTMDLGTLKVKDSPLKWIPMNKYGVTGVLGLTAGGTYLLKRRREAGGE